MARNDDVTATIYPTLTYDDAKAAIEWLVRAFGFQQRLVVPGPSGIVMHSELSLGNGVIMVSSPKEGPKRVGPRNLPAASHGVCVHVADPDAHCARAKAAGARILRAPQDEDYGSRGYMAADPEGREWYFGTYVPGAHWTKPTPARGNPAAGRRSAPPLAKRAGAKTPSRSRR
jgi:uncharacterized glyoxalase superfamily protein PhnB